jgi:hypothetical protein
MKEICHDDNCSNWYSNTCNCTASQPPYARQAIQTDFLYNEDWAELEQCFPTTVAFLRGRNLVRELQYMEGTGTASGLNADYVKRRITELRALGVSNILDRKTVQGDGL